MTTKRTFSASVPLNGKLWVTGGDQNELPSTEYVSPNGDASTPGPDLPSARAGHCAVKLSIGQAMLLGGDYGGNNGKKVIIFDPDTETFNVSLPSLKTDRYNFGCASKVPCMITERLFLQWVDFFEPQLKFWTTLNPIQNGQKVIINSLFYLRDHSSITSSCF